MEGIDRNAPLLPDFSDYYKLQLQLYTSTATSLFDLVIT